jgi:hypothetical protein
MGDDEQRFWDEVFLANYRRDYMDKIVPASVIEGRDRRQFLNWCAEQADAALTARQQRRK